MRGGSGPPCHNGVGAPNKSRKRMRDRGWVRGGGEHAWFVTGSTHARVCGKSRCTKPRTSPPNPPTALSPTPFTNRRQLPPRLLACQRAITTRRATTRGTSTLRCRSLPCQWCSTMPWMHDRRRTDAFTLPSNSTRWARYDGCSGNDGRLSPTRPSNAYATWRSAPPCTQRHTGACRGTQRHTGARRGTQGHAGCAGHPEQHRLRHIHTNPARVPVGAMAVSVCVSQGPTSHTHDQPGTTLTHHGELWQATHGVEASDVRSPGWCHTNIPTTRHHHLNNSMLTGDRWQATGLAGCMDGSGTTYRIPPLTEPWVPVLLVLVGQQVMGSEALARRVLHRGHIDTHAADTHATDTHAHTHTHSQRRHSAPPTTTTTLKHPTRPASRAPLTPPSLPSLT